MKGVTGVEIDMIVPDCESALALYESIFPVRRIEVTSLAKGLNEAVFSMFGTRFHLLDENPAYQMLAPQPGEAKPMWVNVMVEDIRDTVRRAEAAGCTIGQPVTDMPEIGVMNAMLIDPYGYLWMLHELVHEVSFEERSRLLEQQLGGESTAGSGK